MRGRWVWRERQAVSQVEYVARCRIGRAHDGFRRAYHSASGSVRSTSGSRLPLQCDARADLPPCGRQVDRPVDPDARGAAIGEIVEPAARAFVKTMAGTGAPSWLDANSAITEAHRRQRKATPRIRREHAAPRVEQHHRIGARGDFARADSS